MAGQWTQGNSIRKSSRDHLSTGAAWINPKQFLTSFGKVPYPATHHLDFPSEHLHRNRVDLFIGLSLKCFRDSYGDLEYTRYVMHLCNVGVCVCVSLCMHLCMHVANVNTCTATYPQASSNIWTAGFSDITCLIPLVKLSLQKNLYWWICFFSRLDPLAPISSFVRLTCTCVLTNSWWPFLQDLHGGTLTYKLIA